MQSSELTAPLDRCEQYPADPPGLELLNPTIATTLRNALTSYRLPTAARARMLNHLARATGEIEAALALSKMAAAVGPLHRIARGT